MCLVHKCLIDSCSFAPVLTLLLQKTVHVLTGVKEMAVFTPKSHSNVDAPRSEVRGQITPMTKLGIKLTIRYNVWTTVVVFCFFFCMLNILHRPLQRALTVLVYFDMEVNLNKYGHKPRQPTVPCSLPELTKERTCTVVSS